MKSALIGYTGFVGSNILAQMQFDDLYNSKNIKSIKGKEYEIVYCAGLPAAKWIANEKPTEDLQNLCYLIDSIREMEANKFVLISTIDVYSSALGVDEDSFINLSTHHAYGIHRRLMENFISERFNCHYIIRLPGLFGDGLKKNIIYDFVNNNNINVIDSEAIFQFYSLEDLVNDINIVIENNINLVNFATEPISVKELVRDSLELDFNNNLKFSVPYYDVRTKYAEMFGKKDVYIQSKEEVLRKIKKFMKKSRIKKSGIVR
ncbi:hypothetical protein P0082_02820 [Candidatus Haliotispira prima]|uniref:NAD(P)-dependent oxidoreductase n=1 Tax=Candidatus Haliotispira prima TaxID=3034016 RepID=A0ABY8MIG1_9SPIO|nr:hypothetical protein P0082_02820 [Candidatus Haliotispira prima]